MLRKFIGFFLLLSFLTVKGNFHVMLDASAKLEMAQQSEQDTDTDDEKELKNLELFDGFIHHRQDSWMPFISLKKLVPLECSSIPLVHFPVWGPPPNFIASYRAYILSV